MIKGKTLKTLVLVVLVAMMVISVCYATSPDQREPQMILSDYISSCGVELSDNSVIQIKTLNESGHKSQYIEVKNTYTNGMTLVSIIRPFSLDTQHGIRIVEEDECIVKTRDTGNTNVPFSSISITVVANAYYSGSPSWGFIPYGVTAKWIRNSSTTNTVTQMNVDFDVRGNLVYVSDGSLIEANYPYHCPLRAHNPTINIIYGKYKELDSGTGIVFGNSYEPGYGAAVNVLITVNGVEYDGGFII